ncbi:MAG TPA: hypothetical protein VE127_12070 [Solirubrobacteraceae bacterium]|nr:hypothetical protein [Solirubrobacteraceae bacterium]
MCDSAGRAAGRARAGAVSVRVTDADPTNMECRITVRGVRFDVLAAPSDQAWAEWDTTQVHQLQAYGSGAVHVPGQIPQTIMQTSILAAWIPAKHEVFATNATQSRAGSYVTVTVSGRRLRQSERLRLARAVTLATLAATPAGGRPVPPS